MKPEIRAAVFSDTHSATAMMLSAIRRCRPDVVIHLGDYERDAEKIRTEFPEVALYNVAGNCDMYPSAPNADIVPLGPVKAFITHGHLYNVTRNYVDSLVYAAQEQGAQIAMFGHTHRAVNDQLGGVTVINPGSSGKGVAPTFALVEVFDNGAVSCEIREL